MKASKNYIVSEIAGEYILVTVGPAAMKFNGLFTVNEVGGFIFNALQEEQTEESLISKIREEYEVDEETARKDLNDFLDKLRQYDALEEA